MYKKVVIWDSETPPSISGVTSDSPTIMLWRGYELAASHETISIRNLVESNSQDLRKRYLAWIYDLGETQIDGCSLSDRLQLRSRLSYWWMTLLAEKCNWVNSPQIDNAIKLIAFDVWARQRAIGCIRVVSANGALAECLRLWCAKFGVEFKWQNSSKPDMKLSWMRQAYNAFPNWLRACMWLVHYTVYRWPLHGVGRNEWQGSDAQVTFVSYLDSLVPGALTEKRYESRYWANLPTVLQGEGCKTNWLHIYVKDSLLPTADKAADTLRDFNKTGQGAQIHVTLDSFLSGRVLLKTLRDWFRISRLAKALEKHISLTTRDGLTLWPLCADDWRQSMSGLTAMSNLLYLNLFESAMKSVPTQRVGVYLQENQGWEFGLIQAWTAAGHGQIIGCVHSTVRYWHLRYYFDPRSYNRERVSSLPLPDKVAVNGSAAAKAYLAGGYPAEDLVEVEALRYLYLTDLLGGYNDDSVATKKGLRLLVLGDYTTRHTAVQMRWLDQAARSFPAGMEITVKPHPNCPIRPEDYPGLKMAITNEPIAKLLTNCDVAYTSAVTSAAVDAYCAGVPVISVLDPNTLNLSPLRGWDGVQFASRPSEMLNALNAIASSTRTVRAAPDYFRVDPSLDRWKKLLLS